MQKIYHYGGSFAKVTKGRAMLIVLRNSWALLLGIMLLMLGNERVRVPAGEFDTVKIHRIIYPGDPGNFRTETRIDETDWFAPALGRSVRTETNSSWEEPCGRRYCTYRGDWHLRELTEVRKRN